MTHAKETKDCRIALFVAPSTLALIKKSAGANGLSRAEYLRRLLNWGWKLACADEATRDLIADILRDSDGSGEAGETGTGSTEGDSAGPKDIAPSQSAKAQAGERR